MSQLIILDRDGVINHDSMHYIKNPDEWQPIDGSLEAIALLTAAGFTLAVATNQSGIARGLYDETMLDKIHQKMHQLVEQAGGKIDKVWHCPHMPDSGCSCRKPSPGLLLAIAEYYHANLGQTYFIGDRITDIQAAHAASAKSILITSPMTDCSELTLMDNYQRFDSLLAFTHSVLA